MSKYYLEIALNGERHLGADWKFQFPKFGVFADTKEECEKEVREWQKQFIKDVKSKGKKKELEEIPFDSVNPDRPVKMLTNPKE